MRSKLTAKKGLKETPKLLSFWHVVAFIVVVIAVSFFFFPKKHLLKRVKKGDEVSRVTRQYINNLIILYPKDQNLRLLLAQQDIAFGNIKRAFKVIEPYLKSSPKTILEWKAKYLSYQIVYSLVFSTPKGDPVRKEGVKKMREILPVLAKGPFTIEQLKQLARDAVGVNRLDTALDIFARIFKEQPGQPVEVYAEVGGIALSAGKYKMSAQYYFDAQKASRNLVSKKKYFMLAMRSYQAGDILDFGLQQVKKHIVGLQNDKEVLEMLARLALEANKTKQAQLFVQQLIKIQYRAQ